jgi:hypothetical protein
MLCLLTGGAAHAQAGLADLALAASAVAIAPDQATWPAAPAQTTPAAEPPVKAVPQTERKNKPERVADNTAAQPTDTRSARGDRPERSARSSHGRGTDGRSGSGDAGQSGGNSGRDNSGRGSGGGHGGSGSGGSGHGSSGGNGRD